MKLKILAIRCDWGNLGTVKTYYLAEDNNGHEHQLNFPMGIEEETDNAIFSLVKKFIEIDDCVIINNAINPRIITEEEFNKKEHYKVNISTL